MSHGPPTALKPFVRALARLLATDAGARAALRARLAAVRGRKLLREIDPRPRPVPAPERVDVGARRVGIWEARDTPEGREFVRVPGVNWRQWAWVERIAPKRGRRVVLLGESVARGYFYDPDHNVAKALSRALEAVPGLGPTEVVDLAVTAVTKETLLRTAEESLALAPDALVFLAGNNWWPHHTIDRDTLPRVLRLLRGGIHCVRDLLESKLAEDVSHFARRAQELGKALNIPVLVVIPEFNLLDWRSDMAPNAPWLAVGRNEPWIDARERAEDALAASDFARAAEAAQRMMDLDEGVSAVSSTLLGRAKLGVGAMSEARRYLEHARDAEMWTMIPATPRCFGITQRTLRAELPLRGVSFIDLPRLFLDHLGGALPDGRLFLDYCHLTATGIAITARAVATRLATFLGVPTPANALDGVDLMPPARVLAEGDFAAAIHNAMWAQPVDTVGRLCARALEASPDVAETMEQYLDLRVRHVPAVFSSGYAAMGKGEARGTWRYLTAGWTVENTFARDLTRTVAAKLEPTRPGTVERLESVLVEEHAVELGPVDLLRRFYSCDCQAEARGNQAREHAFYQAYRPRSRFFMVVGAADRPVDLDLVLRIPELGAPSSVAVLANGTRVGTARVSASWSRVQVELPTTAIVRGVNVVELEWPRGVADRGKLDHLADMMEAGRVPEFFPVFGEAQRVTASVRPRTAGAS